MHPGATELCNGIDDNCDGEMDQGAVTTWYQDSDGDGYGWTTITQVACSKPAGFVALPGDCHDNNAAIHPGPTELCNGIDDDCDSQID